MGPWGNKQRRNTHFMHFAKMPGFSHDMLLKDVQASYSSPKETLLAQKLLRKPVGEDPSPMMSFSWNMSITTGFEDLMVNNIRAGEEICKWTFNTTFKQVLGAQKCSQVPHSRTATPA